MTEHVLECRWESQRCICTELRACEQRIMLMRYNEIRGWQAMKERIAYDAGLDAAEAAVTLDVVNRGLDAYDDEFLSRSCPHPDGSDSVCYECAKERVVQEVKDAIRALKEKP